MASSESQKRASAKWTQENVKTVSFGLNVESEADIISWLNSKGRGQKAAYIKSLIRADMETSRHN